MEYSEQIIKAFNQQIWNNPRILTTTITRTRTSVADSPDGGFTPGEETTSEITVKGVPYNNDSNHLFRLQFGEIDLGKSSVALPQGTDVQENDLLSWSGKSYTVQSVRQYPINGVNVLVIVEVNEHTA